MSFTYNYSSSFGAVVFNKNVIGATYNGSTSTFLNVAGYTDITKVIPTSGAAWMFEGGQYTSGSNVLPNLVGTLSSSMYWSGSTGPTGIPGASSAFSYSSSFANGQVNSYFNTNARPNYTSFLASGSATSIPVSGSTTMMVWVKQNWLGYIKTGQSFGTYLQVGDNDPFGSGAAVGEFPTGDFFLGVRSDGANYSWEFGVGATNQFGLGTIEELRMAIGNVTAYESGSIQSNTTNLRLIADKWMLLTGVFTNQSSSIYLNDRLIASRANSACVGSTGSLQIGNNDSNWTGTNNKTNAYPVVPNNTYNPSSSFDLGFGAVYNRGLSQSEISTIYQTLRSKYISFPIVNASDYILNVF
jgi:hypothetical protein